jgi:two-component system cell cycle sensor histidine kinase/response regulator CckA
MNCGLLDRNGRCVSLPCDSDAPVTANIIARLPSDCHDEFSLMLREACDDGLRRRLCVTRPDRPPLVVDILPLQLQGPVERAALVILDDSREFDGTYDQLRRLARRNEAILRSSMDGFFVVDADCRFLEVNEAFCAMTGYPADDLLHMRITDLEEQGDAGGGVPSHTRTGLHHFPTAHRHKDGHLIHLEISINVLHNAGEKILVGFARDITERKRAEDALARLTRQQKLILDSAAHGIAGLDRDGRFTFANPAAAAMLGTTAGELIGRPGHDVFFQYRADSRADRSLTCPICSALRAGHAVLRREAQFSRVDGSCFPVEYSVSLMRDGPDVVGAVLGFKDVTEQRRAAEERRLLEMQIQQAQKLESLGLLAGGVAHDLNNTLVGVQGNACIALEQLPQGTELHRRLQRIIGACERASKVIQQMLAYAGHVTCEASPLDLNELIEDMLEFMRAGVPKSITLLTRLETELPTVSGDNGQLQQVITNLLVNAVEAIGDTAGQVTMSTESIYLAPQEIARVYSGQELTPGTYVCLHVDDTGRGMSTETLQRIFEPFFSQKGAGRGLGLAAMRGIVRAHRGGITVDSQPGRGTRFTVVLPALKQAVAPTPAPPPEPQARFHSGATVLVVDDEYEVRDVVEDMLSARGLKVLTAEDGVRALQVFREHADRIDVVLLDMAMPGKGGDQVLREILAIRPNAKVIVSSGFIEESISSRFGDAKPAAFLYKPFTPDTLMERINDVLDGRASPCHSSD